MTRGRARTVFVAGAVAAAFVLAIAVSFALVPKDLTKLASRDVAIASVASLLDDVPVFVTFHDDFGLDVKARELRAQGPYQPMGGRAHQPELPVWVVRTDGDVRAFIAIDPRNGCSLDMILTYASSYSKGATVFHDICHGSVYDHAGQRVGGPSPWGLDQLVLSVRNGTVYADRHSVIPGLLGVR